MLAENRNLVGGNFDDGAVGRGDFALFDAPVVADVNLRDRALNDAVLRDRLGANHANVLVKQVLVIAGVLKLENVLAVRDGDGVGANRDDGLVRDQFDAAIPIIVFDGNCGDQPVFGIDEQGLAEPELASLGDADDGETQNLDAFLHEAFLQMKMGVTKIGISLAK